MTKGLSEKSLPILERIVGRRGTYILYTSVLKTLSRQS